MNSITLPSPFGPNIIQYSVNEFRIFCESEYMLSISDIRYIEELLGFNMYLGVRSHPEVSQISNGKYITHWDILEGSDVDWS